MSYDEDPLDLFDDDGDGVIETSLLFDENEEKPVAQKTGCAVLITGIGASGGLGVWYLLNYWA